VYLGGLLLNEEEGTGRRREGKRGKGRRGRVSLPNEEKK